jgi:putative phosphoribosyl transferase
MPLDVILVRKLGYPEQPEVAMGAISSFGDQISIFWNRDISETVPESFKKKVLERQINEITRRNELYRGKKPPRDISKYEQIVIVDDGIATGSTMIAAIQASKKLVPNIRIVIVSPVASKDAIEILRPMVDKIVISITP